MQFCLSNKKNSKMDFGPISEEYWSDQENPSEYKAGGYFPVKIGQGFRFQAKPRFKIIQKLGWGHFSTVWLVQESVTKKFLALKIQKGKESYRQAALDEVCLLRDISKHLDKGEISRLAQRHFPKRKMAGNETFCVELIDWFEEPSIYGNHICMVFPLIGPSLLDLLRHFLLNFNTGVPIDLVKTITKQILLGLIYIHEHCRIVHTDLKPENIVIELTESQKRELIERAKLPSHQIGSPTLQQKSSYSSIPTDCSPLFERKKIAFAEDHFVTPNSSPQNQKSKGEYSIERSSDKPRSSSEASGKTTATELKGTHPDSEKKSQVIMGRADQIEQRESLSIQSFSPVKKIKANETALQGKKSCFPFKTGLGFPIYEERPPSPFRDDQIVAQNSPDPKISIENHLSWNNEAHKEEGEEFLTCMSREPSEDFEPQNSKGQTSNCKKIFDSQSTSASVPSYLRKRTFLEGPCSNDSRRPIKTLEECQGVPMKWRKGAEILIDHDLRLKIVDFGNAIWSDGPLLSYRIQTREYRSPEAIIHAEYDSATDIWSLGCIVYELITTKFLFKPIKKSKEVGKNFCHLKQMMETLGSVPISWARKGKRYSKFFGRSGVFLSSEETHYFKHSIAQMLSHECRINSREAEKCQDFLLRMLNFDPEKRATARQLLEDPWLQM